MFLSIRIKHTLKEENTKFLLLAFTYIVTKRRQ